MKEHPDKHIRAAIDYARARGWIFYCWREKRALLRTAQVRYGQSSRAHDEHLVYSCRSREAREANYQDGRPLSFNVDGLV